MSLNQIFCQNNAVSILQKAFAADRLAHAYIFAGPQGVGKKSLAIQFAKMMLCLDRTEKNKKNTPFADSCSQCTSCRLIEASSHPDFNLIYKELKEFTKKQKGIKQKTAPRDLSIDVIKDFLIEKVSATPSLSSKKVFIVCQAERLNIESQNALLKVLEEPPPYCLIILLCTRPDKLLPTIKSRCQTIALRPIDEEKIIETLMTSAMDPEHAKFFARLAEGSLGTALTYAQLQQNEANIYQTKKHIINSLTAAAYPDSLSLAADIIDKSKNLAAAWEKIQKNTSKTEIKRNAHFTIVRIIISALRDAMNIGINPKTPLINFDQKQTIEKLAKRLTPELAAKKIVQAYDAIRKIEANANEKLIFEQLLLNLTDSDRMSA